MPRPAENKPDVIILGGGASGLAATCVCAQSGINALLLEKENRVGRKLLATGNGRCNILNTEDPVFFGDPDFARQTLSCCGVEEIRAFFLKLGLLIREEEDGRAYPMTNQAASVLDCLRQRAESSPHITIKTNAMVTSIKKDASGFAVTVKSGETYLAPRLIAAAGGPAAPKLGGSDSVIGPLRALGHRLIPQRPALSALVTETEPIKGLSGLRVPAFLALCDGDRVVSAAAGEALFTDYGVSGVCAMQLSRDAGELVETGRAATLFIDFSPLLGLAPALRRRLAPGEWDPSAARARVLDLLISRRETLGEGMMYTGLIPRPLADKVRRLPLDKAASLLGGLKLPVLGIKGYDQAQVTAGGIDCSEFDPRTMMSKRVPGLYVCGETLNVDGDCGGFNLLFAWASGILAARNACEMEPAAQQKRQ